MANPVHVLYDNFVLESKITDIMNTKLDVFPLMTVDRDLEASAGMKKEINRYTYAGESSKLARGEGNSESGVVTMVPVEYTVALAQQRFTYYDEDVMKDPKIVEVGVNGVAVTMANEIKEDFFTEIAKTKTVSNYTGSLSYDAIVDALSELNVEDESQYFILINNKKHKAELRKDADFKSVNQGEIIVKGHVGFVAGRPVIESKLVVDPIVASKEAVTCFIKKQSEAEQDRDANTRRNDVFGRRVNLVALTDETKAVKLVKA